MGSGRGAGFYRQYAKVADPATASLEAAAAQKVHRYARNEVAQASARWLPGSSQIMAQAAPSFGQPTPISRLGRTGRRHRSCFRHRRAGGSSASAQRALRTRMQPTRRHARSERSGRARRRHAGLVPSKVVPMEGPLSLVCIEPHIILLSAIWDGRRWNNKKTVSFRKIGCCDSGCNSEGARGNSLGVL